MYPKISGMKTTSIWSENYQRIRMGSTWGKSWSILSDSIWSTDMSSRWNHNSHWLSWSIFCTESRKATFSTSLKKIASWKFKRRKALGSISGYFCWSVLTGSIPLIRSKSSYFLSWSTVWWSILSWRRTQLFKTGLSCWLKSLETRQNR